MKEQKNMQTQQGKKNAVGTLLKIVAVKCGKLNSFYDQILWKSRFHCTLCYEENKYLLLNIGSCTEKYDHCKCQTILQFGAVCLVCLVFFWTSHIKLCAGKKKYFFTSERLDCAKECTSYQMVWASDFYIIFFFQVYCIWGVGNGCVGI